MLTNVSKSQSTKPTKRVPEPFVERASIQRVLDYKDAVGAAIKAASSKRENLSALRDAAARLKQFEV